jgi:hypothetical protein
MTNPSLQIGNGNWAYKENNLLGYAISPFNDKFSPREITFTRASDGTRVNKNGLIEKGRENLLLQSNQFDTTWSTASASVTSGQSGYDGSSDAWLLNTTGVGGYVFQSVVNSGVQTLSVYAKAGSYNFIRVQLDGPGADKRIDVNLVDGSTGTAGAGNIIVSTTSVGNGWWRIQLVSNTTSTRARFFAIVADGDSSGSNGNIYIQDAQLEQGLVATEYIETGATTALAGILEDLPRIDYSEGANSPALLLEPQRTNSIISSEHIDSWNKNEFSVDTNSATSPEGVVNASKIIPSTNNADHYVDRLGFSRTADQYITHSVYVKPDGYNYFSLSNSANRLIANFELIGEGSARYVSSNGTDFTNHSASIEAVGNGWYRCILIGQALNSIASYMRISCGSSAYNSSSWNGVGDGTSGVLVYGAQLELNSSYPTSYIPTYGSSVTRGADSCDGAGNSDVINSAEGVLFAEISALEDLGTARRYISLSDGSSNNDVRLYYNNTIGDIVALSKVGGATQFLMSDSGYDLTQTHKIAVKYKVNDFALWIDGVEVDTDSSGSVNAANTFNELAFNGNDLPFFGNVKQVAVFNEALSDSELAALTTL